MTKSVTEIITEKGTPKILKEAGKSILRTCMPLGMQVAINQSKKFLGSGVITQIEESSAFSIATQTVSKNMKFLGTSLIASDLNTIKMPISIISSAYRTEDIFNWGTTIGAFLDPIQINTPEIICPKINVENRDRWKFISIASDISFPIYFEIDTELQNKILKIADSYTKYTEKYQEMIEHCIIEYYSHDILMSILNVWIAQSWINQEQKAAFKEAIEDYEEEKYFGTVAILMCQLGGLINRLYDATNSTKAMTDSEKKEIISSYNVRKIDSEKSKILQMMSLQANGIFLWYRSADYFMKCVYSNSDNETYLKDNPNRHKICHGVQTNYGTQKHALKAILVTDIVFQLGLEML